MKVIIIAGGRGERLKPLTNTLPKPMISIGDKPILEHVINLFKRNGISDFIIALCYMPNPIINYFGDGSKFGIKITYTFEDPDSPLGTSGGILPAKELIADTFIVTYADIRNLYLKEMIKLHKKSKGIATINIYKHTGSNFKSNLKFNEDNTLTKFNELKKSQRLSRGFNWSNGSLYIFEPEIFKYIPKNSKSDFSKDIFPKLLKMNKKISVYPSDDYFIDLGTKESLEKISKDLKLTPSILDD